MNDTITDYNGNEIKVGTRVRMWDYSPSHPEWGQDAKYHGTVTGISDWDGDVDDDTGRSIMVPPYVSVRFDSGDEEDFVTGEWQFYGPDQDPAEGKVEELDAINTDDKE